MTDLASLADALLSAARKAGADDADAMAVDGRAVSIDVRAGALEQAERAEGTDLGLRVLVGRRQASVSASDTSSDTIAEMAARAVAMAREAPEDPYAGLADPAELAQDTDARPLDLVDDGPEPDPAHLQQHALEAEAAARAVPGVTQVQTAAASHSRRDIHLAATNGFSAGYARTDASLYCVAISGEGARMERDHDGDSRTHAADLRSPQEIGASAGHRAVERQAPRKPRTGAYPVLFDERIAASLVAHLLAAANGTAIARGSSWLLNAMDEPVLPEALSLTEDPHRPRVQGSRPFDAEGLPTRCRTIVDRGILRSWTLDLATGRKLGLPSTANAARAPGSTPSPSPWNIALTQGEKTRGELMSEMGTGLLVTSLIGATINPNNGDYSRGASGLWIENGEPRHAVNEVTIAGNLREFLRRITPANDARTHLSRVVPSLLVEGLTLAGK